VNYIRWQGICRELFLFEHVPELVRDFSHGLALVTTRVSCAYHQELAAFDEVVVRMRAAAITPSRLTLAFAYFRVADGAEELVADGEQEIACLRRAGSRLEPIPLPQALRDAVERYNGSTGAPESARTERPR